MIIGIKCGRPIAALPKIGPNITKYSRCLVRDLNISHHRDGQSTYKIVYCDKILTKNLHFSSLAFDNSRLNSISDKLLFFYVRHYLHTSASTLSKEVKDKNGNVKGKEVALKDKDKKEIKLWDRIDDKLAKDDKEKDEIEEEFSSKVEETVKSIEEDLKNKEALSVQAPKRTLWKRIEDEILHYYHGFRLLIIDTRIAIGLINEILNGRTLTRRQHKQLIRTVGDLVRLVPFSVFIIVPFMELLLPFFIKMFPNMLPSTFQTLTEKEKKMKAQLKVKLEMAKFLQQTLDEIPLQTQGHSSTAAKEFAEFFQKIRISGSEVSNEDIMKFSKLFEDEITLDSLSRPQLTALCRVLEIPPYGNSTILIYQLRMKLNRLISDDKVIEAEGVDSLNPSELQKACQSRGMRALGVPEDRLRRQLSQWIQMSLHEKVPPSLLLLSRAMYLPEHLPTKLKLQATISALPDSAVISTKAAIGEREGRVENKTRIEMIKEEQKKIDEEKMAIQIESEIPEKVPDEPEEEEKEVIKDLKEEMADYQEDLQNLNKVLDQISDSDVKIRETKGAHRLNKSLNKIIKEMDEDITELEKEEQEAKLKEQQQLKEQQVEKQKDKRN